MTCANVAGGQDAMGGEGVIREEIQPGKSVRKFDFGKGTDGYNSYWEWRRRKTIWGVLKGMAGGRF